MFIFQTFLRLVGVVLILLLIFSNTSKGKSFLSENEIFFQNKQIRSTLGIDLDPTLNPEEQINDQRPIFGVFDLPSILFIFFIFFGYVFLIIDAQESIFIVKKLLSSSTITKKSFDKVMKKMKSLSENYYTNSGSSLRGMVGKAPNIWERVFEQIEIRIPLEDILQILGNSAALTRKKYDRIIKIFANLSNLTPSFGVMGTVLGLMNVLSDLSDPNNLGPSMALALLTTFYGLFISVVVLRPFLTHLENMKSIEMNGYQAASFWLRNLSQNKPSFYLELDQELVKR